MKNPNDLVCITDCNLPAVLLLWKHLNYIASRVKIFSKNLINPFKLASSKLCHTKPSRKSEICDTSYGTDEKFRFLARNLEQAA